MTVARVPEGTPTTLAPPAAPAIGRPAEGTPNEPPRVAPPAGRVRWVICALLFTATPINYIDRQVLGILAPTLQRDIGWNEADYGNIVSWFTLAYGVASLFAGRTIDALATRVGLALALVTSKLAEVARARARAVTGFPGRRSALGLG